MATVIVAYAVTNLFFLKSQTSDFSKKQIPTTTSHFRVVRMKGKEQCGDGEWCGNHTTQEIKNNTKG